MYLYSKLQTEQSWPQNNLTPSYELSKGEKSVNTEITQYFTITQLCTLNTLELKNISNMQGTYH